MVERNMQKSKVKVVDNFLPIFEFNPIKEKHEGETLVECDLSIYE